MRGSLSKRVACDLLEDFNKKPFKSLGQNYLVDGNVIRRLVSFFDIPREGLVIEIGVGLGFLTEELLSRGYRVLGIEIDKSSIPILLKRFRLRMTGDVEAFLDRRTDLLLYREDIREFSFKKALEITGDKGIFLVGTLPYFVTSSVIFKCFEGYGDLLGMGFVLQKEVGQRLLSREGSKAYGILSVMGGHYFKIEKGFILNERVFYPTPKVKSMALRFERKESISEMNVDLFESVVKSSFNQRRKSIYKALNTSSLKDFSKELLEEAFESFPVLKQKRADAISIEEYVKLTNHYDYLNRLRQKRFLNNVS